MDTVEVMTACKRMGTRPSLLGRAVDWFADHMDPLESDATRNYESWWSVFLSLDHATQLKLVNDERERTAHRRRAKGDAIKPSWMR